MRVVLMALLLVSLADHLTYLTPRQLKARSSAHELTTIKMMSRFYSQKSPFPFRGGPQNPAHHARALHGLSTINAMRDTCLAAKGYRVE